MHSKNVASTKRIGTTLVSILPPHYA